MTQTQLLQIIAQSVLNNPHQAPPIDKRVEFKKGPNAQGAIWSSVMLSSSHLEESVNLMRKVVLKDVREKLRVFNDEIWLEVQGGLTKIIKILIMLLEKVLSLFRSRNLS